MQLIVLFLLLSALGGKGDLAKNVAPVLNLLGDVNALNGDSFDKSMLGNLSGGQNMSVGDLLGCLGAGSNLVEGLAGSLGLGANSSGGLGANLGIDLGSAGELIKTLATATSVNPKKECKGDAHCVYDAKKRGALMQKEYPLQDVKNIADQKILCALSNYVALGC